MKSERSFDGGWRVGVIRLAPCLAILLVAGCDFDAIGDGGAPGIGCSKDLRPTEMAIDLAPYFDGFIVNDSGDGPAPTNPDFLESNHAFAIEWHYFYDSFFTPGPAKHAYVTRVQIFDFNPILETTLDLVWETAVDSEPVDAGDEGWDSVFVWDGLPIGVYEVRVELDPDGDVPECDDLVTGLNNSMTMTIVVHGNSGPPQSPTPCQESEDPNCDDDEGPRGR
jgi:hypothetical protein